MTTTSTTIKIDNRITSEIKARMRELIRESMSFKENNAQIERVYGFKICYHTYYREESPWCNEFWGCQAYLELNNNLIVVTHTNTTSHRPVLEVYSKYKKTATYKGRRGFYYEYDCHLKHSIHREHI